MSPEGSRPDPSPLLAFDREHVWHPYSSAAEPATSYLVESAAGVRLRMRRPDGTALEVDRRDVVLVVRDPRVRRAGAGRGRRQPARPDEPRDVRRAHPRARAGAGPAAARAGAARAGRRRAAAARVLRRLGLGRGRGRAQDGLAGPRRRRPAAAGAVHDPRRLPRRHVRADERLRPGQRHAHAVRGRPAPPGVRPPAPRRAGPARGRPGARGLGAGDPRAVRRARGPGRRGGRRAGAAGRGRHARLQPLRRPRAGRPGPRPRRAARAGRDRDRVRPDRRAVGRRPVRGGARHPVRRQGPDRRLPQPGRGALHRRTWPSGSAPVRPVA